MRHDHLQRIKAWIAICNAFRGVRAGTLDDTFWLRPTAHFWTRSAQPWVVLPPDGQRFETQPADTMGFLLSQQAEGRGI
jgi:hypothetical protein